MNAIDDELELATLWLLDGLLHDPSVRAAIDPMALRVEVNLNDTPTVPLAWEPVPLAAYTDKLPGFIRSSWIFVLRGNSASGAERHPNSHLGAITVRLEGEVKWDAANLRFTNCQKRTSWSSQFFARAGRYR